MSEYNQIQTYVKCDENDFPILLDKAQSILIELNFNQNDTRNWLSQMIWEPEDNGFIYMPDFDEINFIINGVNLSVRPLIGGLTPKISEVFKSNYFEFSLLFETDQIFSFEKNKYFFSLFNYFWQVMNIVSQHFNESGVFLTDEAQDGYQWEAMIKGDPNPWLFDLCLIPGNISYYYTQNNEFLFKPFGNFIGIARKEVWEGLWD